MVSTYSGGGFSNAYSTISVQSVLPVASLHQIVDVVTANVANSQILTYNSSTNTFIFELPPVTSVNGNTGAVLVQPQIAGSNTVTVLTSPSILGGAPGNLNIGGPSGVVLTDNNSNIIGGGVVTQLSSGSSPISGAVVTIPNYTALYYVRGTGSLASLTINLSAIGIANQYLTIIFQVAVTSLNIVAATGYSINLPINNVAIAAGSRINFNLDGTVWC